MTREHLKKHAGVQSLITGDETGRIHLVFPNAFCCQTHLLSAALFTHSWDKAVERLGLALANFVANCLCSSALF